MTKRAKKNRTREENWAINNRVQEYISQGYPLKQAQAIAFRQYRDGELEIPRTKQDRESIKKHDALRTSRTDNPFYLLYRLARKFYDSTQQIEAPKQQE